MLVCIDESGCTGFKLDRGSKPYFIVAMVIFNDFKEAEKCSKKIQELKNQLRIKSEFKFSKTHSNVKEAFFIAARKYRFIVRAIVVEKKYIYSPHLRENRSNFYNYVVQILMKNGNILKDAVVKMDGNGDKIFRRKLNYYLREQLGTGSIKKFRFIDSKQENLIQLADMVVGAIARSYNNHKDGDRWVKLLGEHIDDILELNRPRNLV